MMTKEIETLEDLCIQELYKFHNNSIKCYICRISSQPTHDAPQFQSSPTTPVESYQEEEDKQHQQIAWLRLLNINAVASPVSFNRAKLAEQLILTSY